MSFKKKGRNGTGHRFQGRPTSRVQHRYEDGPPQSFRRYYYCGSICLLWFSFDLNQQFIKMQSTLHRSFQKKGLKAMVDQQLRTAYWHLNCFLNSFFFGGGRLGYNNAIDACTFYTCFRTVNMN